MTYPVITRLVPGDEGTENTLQAMRAMARKAAPVASEGAWLCDAWCIREWLEDHVAFRPDPPDRELVKSPELLLDEVRRAGQAVGDCDDLAVLGAALGLRAGLQARFRVVGFHAGGPYGHVWTELVDPVTGHVVDLDLFRPDDGAPVIRRETIVDV